MVRRCSDPLDATAGFRFGTNPYMNDKWVMRPEDLPFTAPSFFSFVDSVLSSAREPSSDLKADAEARAASRNR